MNFYTCTAKIIEEPKWLRLNNTALSKLLLVKPSNKNNIVYQSMVAIAKGNTATLIFDHYKKNDIVIIEGYLYVKKSQLKSKNSNKKYKIKKYLLLKIQKIHLISNEFY